MCCLCLCGLVLGVVLHFLFSVKLELFFFFVSVTYIFHMFDLHLILW